MNPLQRDIHHQGSPLPEHPPEIWTAILEFLTSTQLAQARLVCRHWNELVVGSPSLLAHFELRLEAKSVSSNNRTIRELLESGTHFSRAALIGVRRFVQQATWWPSIGAHLSELVLKDCRITVEKLLNLLRETPRLRVLKIESEVDFAQCRSNLEVDFQLASLEVLHLNWKYPVGMFDAFQQLCPRLKELELRMFDCETMLSSIDVIEFVGKMRNSLEKVSIQGEDGSILNKLLNIQGLRLKRLEIVGSLERPLPIELDRRHPYLKELQGTFLQISDKDLSQMGRMLPNLRIFAIRAFENLSSPVAFLSRMPNLNALRLICNQDENSNEKLKFTNLDHPNLERLTMSSSRQTLSWIEHFPKLATLELDCCKFNRWSDFLATISKLKNLKILKLEGVLSIDRSQVQETFQIEPTKIEVLDICICNIPKDLLTVLVQACPKLTKVSFGCENELDDEMVLAMCRNSKQLKSLNFIYCGSITNAAVNYVIENCETLVEVSIESCKNVSPDAVQKLKENNIFQVKFRPDSVQEV